MGLLDWLRPGKPTVPEPATHCSFCDDPVQAQLDELAADVANKRFLFRCPLCQQYWGAYVFTPHYRWALTSEEAEELFPDAFESVGLADA